MFGIDSGFIFMKMYDQNKNNKLIMINPNPQAWKDAKMNTIKLYKELDSSNKTLEETMNIIKEVYK